LKLEKVLGRSEIPQKRCQAIQQLSAIKTRSQNKSSGDANLFGETQIKL